MICSHNDWIVLLPNEVLSLDEEIEVTLKCNRIDCKSTKKTTIVLTETN